MSVKREKSEALRELECRMVVTALHKLLIESRLEELLEFLHRLRVRFTLTTTDKGLYTCRVFKQANVDGAVITLDSFTKGGKTPHAAMVNAISDFLACTTADYHDYMHEDWAGHGYVPVPSESTD